MQVIFRNVSAGIGRTGTIVGIFNILAAIETLKQEDSKEAPRVSVFGGVRRLREQRFCMVQTIEQYQYIYDFVGDWIKQLSK